MLTAGSAMMALMSGLGLFQRDRKPLTSISILPRFPLNGLLYRYVPFNLISSKNISRFFRKLILSGFLVFWFDGIRDPRVPSRVLDVSSFPRITETFDSDLEQAFRPFGSDPQRASRVFAIDPCQIHDVNDADYHNLGAAGPDLQRG